jgi:hypothetical protein
MKKTNPYSFKPIPKQVNKNEILIWDIHLLRRIANDLNKSLGLEPPIEIIPESEQTDESMNQLKASIIQGINLTNL